jgi:threonine dehydrogenase-like Zn-dependent dehydrogenase
MQALYFEDKRATLKRVPLPATPPGYALIRVIASGICSTDLQQLRGYYEFKGVPGHEFVGRVEGPTGSTWIGKRVVGEINLACRACEWCRKGWGRHCPNRKVLGIVKHPGAHAEWLSLPEVNLHEVPSEISDEEALFTEPLAAACEILDQIAVGVGTRAAVLGPGKLGRLVSQVLRTAGADVTMVGRPKGKTDPIKPASFDLVVEASGSPEGMPRALRMVRPRGTIVWKSTHHGPAKFDAAPLVVNEVTVVGSRCGRFPPALELLRRRRVEVASLLAAEFPLSKGPKAMAEAAKAGMLKVVLRP